MNKQEIEKMLDGLKRMRIAMFNYCIDGERIKPFLDTAISALERQIPMKPIEEEEEKQYSEEYGLFNILCPVCNNYIGYYTEAMYKPEYIYMRYCNECGQRIDDDWSGDDE